jgi:hypothetical protein
MNPNEAGFSGIGTRHPEGDGNDSAMETTISGGAGAGGGATPAFCGEHGCGNGSPTGPICDTCRARIWGITEAQTRTLTTDQSIVFDPEVTSIETIQQFMVSWGQVVRHVDLASCDFGRGPGLLALAEAPRLTSINLSRCKGVTDKELLVLANMRGLTSVNLHRCWRITGKGLVELAKLPRLATIDLPAARK